MIQNYFSVKGENNMHYGEFSGDMPMSALQAFGGYMSMGGVATNAVQAAISAGTAPSEVYKSLRSTQLATAEDGDYLNALVKVADHAKSQGAISEAQYRDLWKFVGGEYEAAGSPELKARKVAADDLMNSFLGGMSTTAKVMIGVGIVGLLAGGYYLYTKND